MAARCSATDLPNAEGPARGRTPLRAGETHAPEALRRTAAAAAVRTPRRRARAAGRVDQRAARIRQVDAGGELHRGVWPAVPLVPGGRRRQRSRDVHALPAASGAGARRQARRGAAGVHLGAAAGSRAVRAQLLPRAVRSASARDADRPRQFPGGTLVGRPALCVRRCAGGDPEGINVVVLSRTDPPQEFARLAARRQIARIDVDDLRCTEDEAQALLGDTPLDRGHRATHPAAERRLGRGARPAARAPEPSSATVEESLGEGRDAIFQYFAGEIFARAKPANQRALMVTAILRRSPPLRPSNSWAARTLPGCSSTSTAATCSSTVGAGRRRPGITTRCSASSCWRKGGAGSPP